MVSSDSLDSRMSSVADRYSSLFTLPSKRTILMYLSAISLIGGTIASVSHSFSLFNLISGPFLGVFLFFTVLFADFLNSRVFMKSDPILNLRRCSFLSIPSCLILYAFVSAANLVTTRDGNPNLWFKVASAGLFTVLTFRLFVFSAVSSVNYGRAFFSALLQPALILTILSILPMSGFGFNPYSILPFIVSIFASAVGIYIFISSVDATGEKVLETGSLSLFKAFLANWTENLNEPLERFFEKLGEERGVRVSLLAFKKGKGLEAVMIVPVMHPGPFKNVGSSPLPHMIQVALESKLKCIVSVPHGISGHDLDLASQFQNEVVLGKIVEMTELKGFNSRATPFIRSEVDGARASCQIFGDCALFTLTLAPETMEDLPRELDYAITREAEKRGLATAITIDAHNSIQGRFDPEEASESLRNAAVNALEKALRCERQPLEVGAAKVIPQEFTVKDGMGPGGISVIVIKVGDQEAAYVTIDGNNMVSNLREKILLRLKGLGITEGEVLTTDTHVVNGLVKVDRGYHPIGETMNEKRLIDYVEEAASEALGNLEPAEFSWRAENVSGVKIIGERQLNDLCVLTDKTIKRVKRVALLLFPALAILLTVVLILL